MRDYYQQYDHMRLCVASLSVIHPSLYYLFCSGDKQITLYLECVVRLLHQIHMPHSANIILRNVSLAFIWADPAS